VGFVFLLLAIALIGTFLVLVVKNRIAKRPSSRRLEAKIAKRDARIAYDFQYGKPIRVGFLVDLPSCWTAFASVYEALSKDDRFEVVILAMPQVRDGKVTCYDSVGFFEAKGIPFIQMYDGHRFKRVQSLGLHYLFPMRPYDHLRPRGMKNADLAACVRLCHIVYGSSVFRGETLKIVYGFDHLRHYHIVFSETPDHHEIYRNFRKEFPECTTDIVLVGSPKFDAIRKRDFAPEEGDYRQVILYAPRWTMFGNSCSFFDLRDQFFDYARSHPDVMYIFRPHPLMEQNFVGRFCTQEEWDSFIAEFDTLDNAEIDLEPDYLASFKRATVLVADLTSLMPEFLLTGKPLIYAQKQYQFNVFGAHISQGFYRCHNWDEIESVLLHLLDGHDAKKNERQRVIDDYFYFAKSESGELIREYLAYNYEGKDGEIALLKD